MTVGALKFGMGACQRELRQVVVESRRLPCSRRVAQLTGGGYAPRGVVGVLGVVVILLVTAEAIGTGSSELAANMASGAFQGGMRSGKREAGELQVIEIGRVPGVHAGVAGRAVGRKPERFVVRSRRLLIHGSVTRVAVGR